MPYLAGGLEKSEMSDTNAEQAEFWNSEAGRNWAAHDAELDHVMAPATEAMLAAAAPRPGERVLEIGCGAGAATFPVAEAVGPGGRVLGADISRPLLERAEARRRALGLVQVAFIEADAQEAAFEPGAFDLVTSRFGVMFFADPVAAFRNIGRALAPGGRLAFVAWAAPDRNPWFSLPQRVAVARLGPVPPTPPEAPGPTAFRDIDRVAGLLRAAGFEDVRGEVRETVLCHPGGLEAVVALAGEIGPAPRVMREKGASAEDRAAILAGLREAFGGFVAGGRIAIPAALNVFTARAG